MHQMCVQVGSIISAYIYVDSDSPLYHQGNQALFGINLLAIALFILAKLYYVWRNNRREKVWSAMSEEARNDYIANTKLSGSRRLDFRFAH